MSGFNQIKRWILVAASIMAVMLTQNAMAKIYKWVDENGKVHYSDKPFPKAKQKDTQELSIDTRADSSSQSISNQFSNQRANAGQAACAQFQMNSAAWQACQTNHLISSSQAQNAPPPTPTSKSGKPELTRCQKVKKDYEALTQIKVENGIRSFNTFREDGNIVSQERKDEVIAELKKILDSSECRYELK
ncbi:DUF4124 domain-containing protein [Aliikangiella maris]|uniref:DUF4124 domain-containing protein n=2 Tax=Aliikangiella maris TaxID=3162458 RepID=A0ABV2BY58_9GAMM